MSDEKLNLNDVLRNIDNGNVDYYNSLPDNIKKEFSPYVIQRWLSGLDDSIIVEAPAKTVENIFGKWADGGKEVIQSVIETINSTGEIITNVSKYSVSKFDWRIKFSVVSSEAAIKLIDIFKNEFNLILSESSLISSEMLSYHIMCINNNINMHLWEMNDEPDVMYKIMCGTANMLGNVHYSRTWLPFAPSVKNINSEIKEVLKYFVDDLSYNQMSLEEYKLLVKNVNLLDFQLCLSEMGFQADEYSRMMKLYMKEREKYGYRS